MNNERPIHGRAAFFSLTLSILVLYGLFLWQGATGFNLWDEGFLWYGVQRVLQGEVPIRDFMAYDPGRYYWTAAILRVVGDDGIMSVRAAVALFQGFGLFVGILLVAVSAGKMDRSTTWFLLLSTFVLVLWMFPRHKLFDLSISIFLIGTLAFLISKPTPARYLLAGFSVGLIAVFGRNHGLYGLVGSVGVIVWINIRNLSARNVLRALFLWTTGAALGFLPIIGMAVFVPGFGAAFVESLGFFLQQKSTNLPLPVPWPWAVDFKNSSLGDSVRGVLVGAFFVGTLVFAAGSLLWVVRQRIKGREVPPALAAAAFLSIPYAHYAFSRADVGHLAHGIFPFLIGNLVILSRSSTVLKWTVSLLLLVSSFWVMHIFHPGWYCYTIKQCVEVDVSGSKLMVDSGTASDIALLRGLADKYAPQGRAFLATPYWPGAYALLDRRSPMWEVYALFPRSESFERKEIERIVAARPGFAVVTDLPLDGREELRFKITHPLINQYVMENFEPVELSTQSAYRVYRAREDTR